MNTTIEGLKPNGQEFCYRLAGYDQNVTAPEAPLTSADPETISFTTPLVSARIVGPPSVSHIRDVAAVMSARFNPENATTEDYFEYSSTPGALEACPRGLRQARRESADCPDVAVTPAASSALYGETATSLEAGGLQPDTTYEYRLFAEDESDDRSERLATVGAIGMFTTAPGPTVKVATGTADEIGATSAVVSGKVDGGGQPAKYSFELGVYKGSQTRYATVVSGSTSGEAPESKSVALSGLQPATAYAFRISISSGYVHNEQHTLYAAPATFVTQAVASSLAPPTVLPQLPVPPIQFPKAMETIKGKPVNISQQLAKALRACHAKPHSRRAACERAARKQYKKAKFER